MCEEPGRNSRRRKRRREVEVKASVDALISSDFGSAL
jgi:hypothetical protein